ncbi:metallophosphoesterase [Ramlibacter sp.]|uniref:metallophosphoesterase n=1 Tax=Ramlibacter sp. TaxID=1917967 RepID=UPI00261AF91E|nr:metallophosphoesterase [Ramlibacter sp.]MDB5956162.1 metallophosphoesterase [Ramlibacter sp.]
MKLHVLSDLHLSQAGFDPPDTDADVVVLAGDIARPREAIAWARRFRQPVLYVAGNHEFYGASVDGTRRLLHELCADTHVHVLDDEELTLDGVRFLGTTLWTDFNVFGPGAVREAGIAAATRFMRDFQRIRLREEEDTLLTPEHSAGLFRQHSEWLQQRLAQSQAGPTVVITHHAPSPRSIHPRFAGAPVNVCFVSDAEHLLGANRVQLWVHGHTHDSFDYDVAGTRVVCNPRGYLREGQQENARFDPGLVIELN